MAIASDTIRAPKLFLIYSNWLGRWAPVITWILSATKLYPFLPAQSALITILGPRRLICCYVYKKMKLYDLT